MAPDATAQAAAAPSVVDAGAPEVALGRIERPTGEVTLERGGRRRAALEEPLFALDAVETGADGKVSLRFSDTQVVELGPDGRFEVQADGSSLSLNVVKGLVLTRVPRRGAGVAPEETVSITINTPFGLTRVGAAEVLVKVDGETADVDVKFGAIELVTRDGAVKKLEAGQQGALGKVRTMPEIPLSIVLSQGQVELRRKDDKRFAVINSKKPPALAAGDTVRVKSGRFTLSPEGSQTRVSVLPGSEVGVEAARKGVGGDLTMLDVRRGALEVIAPPGQRTSLGVAPGVTLVSDLGGQFSLRRTGSGFEVDAVAGDVRIERSSQPDAVVPGGRGGVLPLEGGPVLREPTREVVVVPARAVRLLHSGLKRVSLQWADEPGDFWFQLASDGQFTTLLRDGLVHDGFVNVPALPRGTYFWRVFAGRVEGEPVARGQLTFGAEPRATDLSRLQNVVKAGSETTTILFQDRDKPPVVTFSWLAEEGAAKYELKVFREGALASPLAQRVLPDVKATLAEAPLGEGRYLWSVTPLDAKGAPQRGGRMNKLHLVFDNAVASLLIKSPQEGEVAGRQAKTSGVAPVGSKLFINGRPIELDAQARFDVPVNPLPGGRIVYRSVSPSGESWIVRTVKTR